MGSPENWYSNFFLEPGQLWLVKGPGYYLFRWSSVLEEKRAKEKDEPLRGIELEIEMEKGLPVMVVGVRDHFFENADSVYNMNGAFLCDLMYGDAVYMNQTFDPGSWYEVFEKIKL